MRFATVTASVNGPAIKALRQQQDLTLEAVAELLAKKLGCPVYKATLSRIENNKLEPGEELFNALCELLDGDPEQLLTIEVPQKVVEHVRKLADPATRAPGGSRAS